MTLLASGAPLGRKSHTMYSSLGYGIDTYGRSTMLLDVGYNYKNYDFGMHANVNNVIAGGSFFIGYYNGYFKYSIGSGNVHEMPIQGDRYLSGYYSIKYLPVKYFYLNFEHHLLFDFGFSMNNEIILGTGFNFPLIFW